MTLHEKKCYLAIVVQNNLFTTILFVCVKLSDIPTIYDVRQLSATAPQ